MISSKNGFTLIEIAIGLGIIALVMVAILQGLNVGIRSSDHAKDKATMMLLAQSQLEDIMKQSYQPSPANYSLISSIPEGYSLSVAVSIPYSYTYSTGSAAYETLQLITVTASGDYSTVSLSGYKARQ